MKNTTKFYAIVDGKITEHSTMLNAIKHMQVSAQKWAKILNSKDPDEIMLYFDNGE